MNLGLFIPELVLAGFAILVILLDLVIERKGWLVIRAWEHEDPQLIARQFAKEVEQRRQATAAGDGHRSTASSTRHPRGESP